MTALARSNATTKVTPMISCWEPLAAYSLLQRVVPREPSYSCAIDLQHGPCCLYGFGSSISGGLLLIYQLGWRPISPQPSWPMSSGPFDVLLSTRMKVVLVIDQ